MSKTNRWRSIAALVAPLLGATLFNGTVQAGKPSCLRCPPVVKCCPPLDPCKIPPAAPAIMGAPVVAPPLADPVETPVELVPETSLLTEPQPLDLSTGLATDFGAGGASSLAFADTPVMPGYIDSAVIQNRVRIRYDNAQNSTEGQRERAGFMYPTPSSVNANYLGQRGPDYFGIPPVLDIETLSVYVETVLRDRFSLFIDVPIRWVSGPIPASSIDVPEDPRGVGDISTGFRWGWINCPDEHLTFQFRTTVPTGDPLALLGTGNTSIDFGLLYDQLIGERTRLFAEIVDWQTLDAVNLRTNAGGGNPVTDPELLNQDANILRFGIGLGYDLLRCGTRCNPKSVTAITEIVGWTVLDGNTPANSVIVDAEGDTIINGKYGVRVNLSEHSFYVGYGHNWTDDFWYTDLLRLEWQRSF